MHLPFFLANSRHGARPYLPTPSGAEFRERPPSGQAQRYLPTLTRSLPAPRPYLPTLAQVFAIAAVTYLPGQRDATLTDCKRPLCGAAAQQASCGACRRRRPLRLGQRAVGAALAARHGATGVSRP
jgi:hypothetical protein